MGAVHILDSVYGYLGGRDLASASRTSGRWRAALLASPMAAARRKDYLLERKLNLV